MNWMVIKWARKCEIWCQIRLLGNKRLSDGMETHKGSKKVKGKNCLNFVIFLVGRLNL
jgi:hypothetical protein